MTELQLIHNTMKEASSGDQSSRGLGAGNYGHTKSAPAARKIDDMSPASVPPSGNNYGTMTLVNCSEIWRITD